MTRWEGLAVEVVIAVAVAVVAVAVVAVTVVCATGVDLYCLTR